MMTSYSSSLDCLMICGSFSKRGLPKDTAHETSKYRVCFDHSLTLLRFLLKKLVSSLCISLRLLMILTMSLWLYSEQNCSSSASADPSSIFKQITYFSSEAMLSSIERIDTVVVSSTCSCLECSITYFYMTLYDSFLYMPKGSISPLRSISKPFTAFGCSSLGAITDLVFWDLL